MNFDPYSELGVPRDADAGKIRRAYRSRARKTHPDGGGSPREFALTKLAHDILSDEARRERYDRTGDVSETEVDTGLASALQNLSAAMDEVLTELVKRGLVPHQQDLPALITAKLNDRVRATRVQLEQLGRAAEVYRTLFRRWSLKGKEGTERIEALITGKLAQIAQAKDGNERVICALEDAIVIVQAETFKADPSGEQAYRFVQINPWSTTAGASF